MSADLTRIADALERAFPAPAPAPPADAPAYRWDGRALAPVPWRPLPLALLRGIEGQASVLLANTQRLAAGAAAHDALLWGVRGTGKSALVKAVVGVVQADTPALALVAVMPDAIDTLPALFDRLAALDRPVVVFIDDLGFEAAGDAPRRLRSLLDGGAAARQDRSRLYVTANRRHVVPRHGAEQDDPLNARDVVEDRLALADRFGLSLGFHAVDQDGYLAMVSGYADALGLDFDPADALRFATQRGARSGRVARHYAVDLAGRAGRDFPF